MHLILFGLIQLIEAGLLNLLSNAIKYTEAGEIEIKIETKSYYPQTKEVEIQFSVRIPVSEFQKMIMKESLKLSHRLMLLIVVNTEEQVLG